MDDLDVLARDFGFRPPGKSGPMRSEVGDRRSSSVRSSSPLFDDHDGHLFNDVFGGPPKHTSKSSSINDLNYDSIFKSGSDSKSNDNDYSSKKPSVPVYDKPVYDDEDIFDGLPGLKSKSVSTSAMRFDDNVFATMTDSAQQNHGADHFDDLLGSLGKNEKIAESKSSKSSSAREFDDLFAGFGSSSTRSFTDSSEPTNPARNINESSSVLDDPFVNLESTSVPASSSPGEFTNPLKDIGKHDKYESAKADASSVSGAVFDDDQLNGFGKSVPPFSLERNSRGKDGNPSRAGLRRNDTQTSTENFGKSFSRSSESHLQEKVPRDAYQESHLFDMPSVVPQRSFGQAASSAYASSIFHETNYQVDTPPRSEEQVQPSDDVWLTVSEIPLFTQPTTALPPSRPPPPIPRRTSKPDASFFTSTARKKGEGYSSSPSHNQNSQSPIPVRPAAKSPPVSQLDELEDFAMGRSQNIVDENADEEINGNSVAAASAAAMKEAMDRAEAKFRHAKEVREREHAKAAKSKEALHPEREEQTMHETHEREFRENQERLEREQQREKEEEERAQRRLERERERSREIERERGRQAVERATREARERAAVGARDRAAAGARLKAERAAVDRASAEARERAERAAVQRAQAESRERAAAEARERAEKAAAEAAGKEAQEKASAAKVEAEARRRAERAAVERATAEARERAAAAARMNQQNNDNDLESFFNMRANSASKTRSSSSDTAFDSKFETKTVPERPKSTSGVASSNIRKAVPTTTFVDDLSSIFGAAPSGGEFQEVEGETEERRRARLERNQRTQERAAKAVAEKNERDLQAQREHQERQRIAETLDIEIKRWAAGKEGNLRALLSTLQYVLWPECGWEPVSLTDLIVGASVKKVYRKATLCLHPDKVQQKGATLLQKCIAEKVFDLLKEAWNKFNSEELF